MDSYACAAIKCLTADLSLQDIAIRRDTARKPDIAANRRTTPDRDAAENCRARIDHDIVFNDRMPRLPFDERTALVNRETLRAERHGLVETHTLADDGGLADYDSSSMIDEESGADLRTGMNIDSRLRMREFGDNSCNDGRTENVQRVRHAMMNDRPHARKTKDDFFRALRGRIAFVSSANIRFERCIKFRKLPGERTDDFIRRILRSLPSAGFIDESMLSMNLLDQDMQSGVQAVAYKEAKRVFAMIQSACMARK